MRRKRSAKRPSTYGSGSSFRNRGYLLRRSWTKTTPCPVLEQQLDPSSVLLSTQGEKVLHAVALVGGTAIGTGRVVYPADPHDAHGGHVARIGRMAVEKAWRRQGIGSRILETLEEEARRRGMSQAILHAQTYVKSFYASRGYIEEGEVFLEVEIEHVRMRKRL